MSYLDYPPQVVRSNVARCTFRIFDIADLYPLTTPYLTDNNVLHVIFDTLAPNVRQATYLPRIEDFITQNTLKLDKSNYDCKLLEHEICLLKGIIPYARLANISITKKFISFDIPYIIIDTKNQKPQYLTKKKTLHINFKMFNFRLKKYGYDELQKYITNEYIKLIAEIEYDIIMHAIDYARYIDKHFIL